MIVVEKLVKQVDKRSEDLLYQIQASNSRPTKIYTRPGAELIYN